VVLPGELECTSCGPAARVAAAGRGCPKTPRLRHTPIRPADSPHFADLFPGPRLARLAPSGTFTWSDKSPSLSALRAGRSADRISRNPEMRLKVWIPFLA